MKNESSNFPNLLYFPSLLDFSTLIFIWQIWQILSEIPYYEKLKLFLQ